MTLDAAAVRSLCASMAHATADFPFGPGVEVFRVGGKMFALLDEAEQRVNLKSDPPLAELLRQRYPAVIPGYHQDKRHWNTVMLDGTVPDEEVEEMLRGSYALVLASLTRRQREALGL